GHSVCQTGTHRCGACYLVAGRAAGHRGATTRQAAGPRGSVTTDVEHHPPAWVVLSTHGDLEFRQRGVEVCQQPLQMWNAPATPGDAEVDRVAGAGERDVQRLPVQQYRGWIDAVERGAVPVHLAAWPRHVRNDQVERRLGSIDQAR